MAHVHFSAPDPKRVPGTTISNNPSCSEAQDDLNIPGSRKLTIDQIIENEARRCWDEFVDDGKIESLFQDHPSNDEVWFDPRLQIHSFKSNAGLFHAIIKHGSSFDFLKNPNMNFWLENLNKSCEKFKKFPTATLKENVEIEIRENFDEILKLSKGLGEHVKELIENTKGPVLMVSNEKAILVFSKILDSRSPRYYMFVLADGAGHLPKFTLITAMRLRANNFKKRIMVNGKIPKLWFDFYTERIHYCRPETLNDNGLYISLGRAKEQTWGFEEFL